MYTEILHKTCSTFKASAQLDYFLFHFETPRVLSARAPVIPRVSADTSVADPAKTHAVAVFPRDARQAVQMAVHAQMVYAAVFQAIMAMHVNKVRVRIGISPGSEIFFPSLCGPILFPGLSLRKYYLQYFYSTSKHRI